MTTKYWVGNGGNWSDTAHWSLSSGGAGGASEPVAGDTAVFDLNSGSYNFTVKIHSGTNAQCNFVISNTHVAFEVLGELSLSNNIEYLRGLTINGGTLTTNNYNIYVYDWIRFVFDYSAYLGSSTITFAGSLSFTEVEGFNYICSASSAKFVATLDNPAPTNGHYIDVQSDIELGEFSITTNHTNTFYIIGNTSFSKVTLTGSGPVTTSFNQPYTTTIRMPGGLTLIGEPQSSWLTLINANFSMALGSCDAHNIVMLGCTASGGAIFYALTSNGCIDGGGNTGWIFDLTPPPEPVFAAPIGQYNEGDHFAYAPGDSGGTAVWREAGTSSAPITDIHRPGCGYWFKETRTVYGGEVGPWVPWNVDQKVEFNEGSKIVKSPTVSGGTPIWEVGKTGPAITDTHVPCGYWNKK